MNRSWWYRLIFMLFLFVISTMAVIPTFFGLKDDSSFPVKSKINLGLDLQGGLYMVLGIDFNKVYKDEIQNYLRKVESTLNDEGITNTFGKLNLSDETDPRHSVILNDPTKIDDAKAKVREYFTNYLRVTGVNGGELEYGLGKEFRLDVESKAVKKSIEVIRNRIDEFGVTEPEIVSLGSDRIVVQLPGVKDIERAKELIGKTAKLEFKIVNDDISPAVMNEWIEAARKDGIEYKRGQRFSDYIKSVTKYAKDGIPNGYELAFEKVLNKVTNEVENLIPYVIESSTILTGDGLQDAITRIDPQNNQPFVSLIFKPAGGKAFGKLTTDNVQKRMAIVLDGNVYSAPVINEPILGGQAQITLGQGSKEQIMKEASDLSLVLRAGALPVELEFQEQRIVGPSLGADSIATSKKAGLIAAALVFLFIMVYYKMSGVLAMKTLALNILFILGCLVGLEATLTLPGIAGIALTIGMAVDANIIIFERIKEELREGTPIREAVETGFARAFWTILDANLTTAVAGLMLLNFGTGPIRGFAVTLIIGIICTVYTAYFVGKLFFEYYLSKTNGKNLSI
ncbi:MAG: protein translocase subunit SecD [Bacteriovoracaceae bacterium]|jgi:protein-export membrane protein SecD|nr:protein translocase subunit SecD [Bacteriovoracaceae bacterium]